MSEFCLCGQELINPVSSPKVVFFQSFIALPFSGRILTSLLEDDQRPFLTSGQ